MRYTTTLLCMFGTGDIRIATAITDTVPGTGAMGIGGMDTGDTVTTGTAGKWQRPCEGGCKLAGLRWLTLLLLLLGLLGCFLTKVATVPMRVGGAVASVVPVVGNPAHDAIDKAADTVDALPF